MKEDRNGSIMYPEGCTLNVSPPAKTLCSTGVTCYPFRRPILAISVEAAGKLCVVGSCQSLSDGWIDKGNTCAFLSSLLEELTGGADSNFSVAEISDYRYLCDTAALARSPIACMDEEDLYEPEKYIELAKFELFDAGCSLESQLDEIYAKLGIPFEKIQPVIRPKFATIPISRVFAVHPPSLYPLLERPELPLLDLDEMLTPPELRLNRLANKCSEGDVEYFLVEAGGICNIGPEMSAASVLIHLFNSLL